MFFIKKNCELQRANIIEPIWSRARSGELPRAWYYTRGHASGPRNALAAMNCARHRSSTIRITKKIAPTVKVTCIILYYVPTSSEIIIIINF
jgi:hypothetical protein